jgi:P-type conjugative transfer protein TrbJ
LFQSVSAFLDSLDGNFNGGINSGQIFAAIFPGWLPLPTESIPQVASVTTKTLATYSAALNAAQSQAASFDAEENHLSSIESANLGAAGLLQAVQINTEAQLAAAQQIRPLRQLEVSHITLDATKAGEELNERARTEATSAQAANLGVSPQ